MPELPDLSSLTHEQKDALILALYERAKLLEGRLSKNSHNSSKPPSSDGLNKKPQKTQSLRQPSGKSPGGQTGHPGKTLKRVETPDETLISPLPALCECGAPLDSAKARVVERRQVVDIPTPQFHVVEHQSLQLTCSCGYQHRSDFPSGVNDTVQYGPNIRALAVHLIHGQMLPYARAAEHLADLYRVDVSPATLLAWTLEAKALLEPAVAQIADSLQSATVLHADESGMRVAGKLHWLHAVVTDTLTWYGIHPKRGMEAIETHGILTQRIAVLVHDCWAPYWQIEADHALCNAHLLRELLYLHETTGQAWPKNLMDLLCEANRQCDAARQQDLPALPTELVTQLKARYNTIRQEGEALNPEVIPSILKRGRTKQSVACNLLRRLRQRASEVLRFIDNLAVPFTNNLAERAIRMPKVKQKISGCFRTLEGAEAFAVIRSYLDTLRKQGIDCLDALRSAFRGNPIWMSG